MEIKKRETKTFIERMYCKCGLEMKRDSIVLTSNPPQYTMYCPKRNQVGGDEHEMHRGHTPYPRQVEEEI